MGMVQKKITRGDVTLIVFFVVLSFLFVYPLLNMIALSLSDATVLQSKPVFLWPKGFSMEAYKALLKDDRTMLYYWNTIKYAGLGTLIMLVATSMLAYALSVRAMRGRKLISVMLTITMFFGGGLIPTYIIMQKLRLINTIWAIILPGAISAYNAIVFKTFFMTIPESLKESAYLDGAGHFRVLIWIVIPLSKALLATFTLFSVVGYWNNYLTAILYIRDSNKYPIQVLLRRLLVLMDYKDESTKRMLLEFTRISTRTTKAAATIITVLPILCVYPFLQKYFAQGTLVGSIKA